MRISAAPQVTDVYNLCGNLVVKNLTFSVLIEYMTLSITSLYEHSATCNYTGQTVAWLADFLSETLDGLTIF
jgi:hypothetical protein